MAEWLIEEGIGEHRAILYADDQAVAARVDWPGALAAGQIEDAVLIARATGSPRGTVRFASGEEALVDKLPGNASEGAPLRVIITRAAIAEVGRYKRAHARPSSDEPRPAPSLAEQLGQTTRIVRQFPTSDWDELFAEAWQGEVAFNGGMLTISPTPAMTLIDIDGTLPPRALSLAAVPALGQTIRLFDLAGSIGIDFPTLADKADRRALDQVLAEALGDWPHERTAMNGFGFVQLVARLQRPSLLHRIQADRAGAAALHLLRRAELVSDPGALLLTAHPTVKAKVTSNWESDLARRTGRVIRWHSDPALALDAVFAQAVPL